jgi:hypothetical protein
MRVVRALMVVGAGTLTVIAVTALTGCGVFGGARNPDPIAAQAVMFDTPYAAVATSTASVAGDADTVVYQVVIRTPSGEVDRRDPFRLLAMASEQHERGDVLVIFRSVPSVSTERGRIRALTWRADGNLDVSVGEDDGAAIPASAAELPATALARFGPTSAGVFDHDAIMRIAQGVDPVPAQAAAYWEY